MIKIDKMGVLCAAALLASCNTFEPPQPEDKNPVVRPSDEDKPNDNPADENTPDDTPQSGNIIHAGSDGVWTCGVDIRTWLPHDGTEGSPYIPSDLLTKADIPPTGFSTWIYGYAVGYVDASGKWNLTATSAADDNVLVSDVCSGCNEGNTLLVELMDKEMRRTMSLAARPDSLNALVRFYGKLTARGTHRTYCLQTDSDYSADWLNYSW